MEIHNAHSKKHWIASTNRATASLCTVIHRLDLVDANQPVFRGERLLQVLQLEVLATDLSLTHAIIARWLVCTERNKMRYDRTNKRI